MGVWRYSSTLDRWEWSVSLTGRIIPGKRALGTYWIRGWVGPRSVMDAVAKRKKIPIPAGEIDPSTHWIRDWT